MRAFVHGIAATNAEFHRWPVHLTAIDALIHNGCLAHAGWIHGADRLAWLERLLGQARIRQWRLLGRLWLLRSIVVWLSRRSRRHGCGLLERLGHLAGTLEALLGWFHERPGDYLFDRLRN